MKVLKIMAGIIGGFVILGIALTIVLAVAAGKAVSDQVDQGKAITAKAHDVHLGMTKQQVRAILGPPSSTQSMQMAGLGTEVTWYYGILDWQLVFTDNHLTAKNHY